MAKKKTPKSAEVKTDRRAKQRRAASDRRNKDEAVVIEQRKGSRRKVARRRQIDPTTCERDYSNDEIEFMHALDEYKRANGRMFPTCSEILEVVRKLGYEKQIPGSTAQAYEPNTPPESVASVEALDFDEMAAT